MIQSEFRFTLDTHAAASQVSLGVKKGETGRRLRIHLTEAGYPYHIPDNCYAVFAATKPDGKKIFNDCVIDDCEIIYDMTEQTVAAAGLMVCAINLYGVENDLLISASFSIIVYCPPVDQDDLESTSEYKALAALIAEAEALKEGMEEGGGPGGYYVPIVDQPTENTVQFSWMASGEGLPAVPPAVVELPSGGNDSGQNLDLTFHEGKLYITVNGVRTGNGVVVGTVEETVYHNIVLNLTNCVSSNDVVKAEEHSAYTTVISPEIGYIMNNLTVTMGGESLTPENGTIHIEDVTGEIRITASAISNTGGVDLSGIVAWYQTDVQDAYNYVAAMDADKWVHHVVLADTHYGYSQYGNSMEIVAALMDTGLFDKFLHLGDLTDVTNDDNWRAVIEDGYERFNGNMLFVYGNHDNNVYSDTLTTGIFKTALLSNGNFTWFNGDDYCYYYDDSNRKIRYVCLNLWAGAENVTAQIAWLNNLLGEMTADWTVFVLVHGESTDSNFYNGLLFSDVNVGGVIEGHWHVDRLFNPQNIPRVRLLCDRGDNPGAEAGEEHLAPTERVQGTNSEHAITIMSINPTERLVRFYRIGAYAPYYESVFPNILEYSYDDGDSVYWNDGYWRSTGEVENWDGYKYETQLRELKTGETLYVYCSDGENTLSDILAATYTTKNVNEFHRRFYPGNPVKFEDALTCKFGYLVNGDIDLHISVSCDGWDNGKFAVTDNPDDFRHQFGDTPTVWTAGFISAQGEKQAPDSDTVAYSNTIKVKPNTTYRLSSTSNALTWYGISLYSAPIKEGFISRVSTATFTTPENCKYAILSAVGVIGNEDTITFEEVTS